jgi:hypothetical protein
MATPTTQVALGELKSIVASFIGKNVAPLGAPSWNTLRRWILGIEELRMQCVHRVAARSQATDVVASRSSTLGPASRPVAVPSGLDTSQDAKARGEVELPIHIWWSEPKRIFNMENTKDRLRVYELVLSEGDEEDVRYYVQFDDLQSSWHTIFLPRHVRGAWEAKFPQLRNGE